MPTVSCTSPRGGAHGCQRTGATLQALRDTGTALRGERAEAVACAALAASAEPVSAANARESRATIWWRVRPGARRLYRVRTAPGRRAGSGRAGHAHLPVAELCSSVDWAKPGHCEWVPCDDLTMRMIVEILMTALAISNNVPPIDPVMILLASHNRVLASNTHRNGTPRILIIAIVAMQEPITGNQPAMFLANATPRPMFTPIIAPPSNHDRYRSARNDRNDDSSALEQAGRFPSKTKCRA